MNVRTQEEICLDLIHRACTMEESVRTKNHGPKERAALFVAARALRVAAIQNARYPECAAIDWGQDMIAEATRRA